MSPDSEDAVPFGKTSPTNSTLWAMPPVFFHSTVSPTLTVTVLGMNSPGASLMTITAAGSSRPLGPASAGLVRHTKPATAMATSAAARTRCILGVVPIIVGLLRDKLQNSGLRIRLLPCRQFQLGRSQGLRSMTGENIVVGIAQRRADARIFDAFANLANQCLGWVGQILAGRLDAGVDCVDRAGAADVVGPPLRCGRSFASAENPEHLCPTRDGVGLCCNRKRRSSGRRANALRRTRRGGRVIRGVSVR